MSNVWLKCDNCNKELKAEAERPMTLAVRFKPSLFTQSVAQIHPAEHRQRCRSCGWVNIFVPATAPVIACSPRQGPLLTPSWRIVSLKS